MTENNGYSQPRDRSPHTAPPPAYGPGPNAPISAEYALLGAILLEPERVLKMLSEQEASPGLFDDSHCRVGFTAAQKINTAGRVVDVLTVSADLAGTPGPGEGWLSFLNVCIDSCPTFAHAPGYLAMLQERDRRRRLAEVGATLSRAVSEKQPLDDVISLSLDSISKLRDGTNQNIVTRSLTSFADAEIDASQTLLGNRYLCREGGMLFVGPSGVGKSSASVQQDILWSLGQPAFGIKPSRPLIIATIQAENDDGDLSEMARGIMIGLELSPSERDQVNRQTFYVAEKSRTGPAFIRLIESLLRQTRPDLLRIDPLQSYLGADTSDVEAVSGFVHSGLNPLLKEYKCACVINHHTPKTTNRDSSKWRNSDWQYAGAGSAVLTNWARAILVVDPCEGDPHLFKFIAAKRAYRIGWANETGDPVFIRHFKHAREQGVIFWMDAQPDEIVAGSKPQHSKDDILALVPPIEPIFRDALISKAQSAGIGEKKSRRFINELIAEGNLHQWRTKRKGTNPRIDYARIPQPNPELNI